MKKQIIILIVSIVILAGAMGGVYFWWTGTPKYSLSQIKKAYETHDSELGLKYIDTDAIVDNLWVDLTTQVMNEDSGSGGLEELGMMLGLQLIEGMKPVIKEQVKQEIINSFSQSKTEEQQRKTSTSLFNILKEGKFKITRQGDSVYLESPDNKNMTFVFAKRNGERHWVIIKLSGLADDFMDDILLKEQTGDSQQEEDIVFITKNIGENVELATLNFTINSSEESQSISSEYNSKFAREDAKFVIVNLDVVNTTKEKFALYPGNGFSLVDNQGRQYITYEDFWIIDNYLNGRNLSPSLKENGVFVYEVPNDATSYSLNVGKANTNEVYKVIIK